jgi:ubiquinone/menaquinone biosynthesis C-methylase UbiE
MRSFDRVAEIYDATRGLPPGAEASVTAGIVEALRELGATPRVLEVGIGTGRIAVPLEAAGVHVVGIDIARKMVAHLRAKHAELPVVLAESRGLPFAGGRFDAALFVHVLHLVPDAADALRAGARVVRRGGLLLVARTDYADSPRTRVMRVVQRVTAEVTGIEVAPVHWNVATMKAVRAVAAELGSEVTERVIATYEESTTGREVLAALAGRVYSSTWTIPEEAMPEIVRRVTPEVEEILAGLDRPSPNTATITLAVCRVGSR